MEISLDRLKMGQRGKVVSIATPTALTRRLCDLGMIPGTHVCCQYRTPCGRVTALELRGSIIALRTRDMEKIRVQN